MVRILKLLTLSPSNRTLVVTFALAAVTHAQSPDDPRWQPPQEMAALTQLVGVWNVAIEMRTRLGAEPVRSLTTSRIDALFGGAFIQQDLEMPLPAGRPGRMRVVAGFDKFRRVYRLNVLSDLDALSDVYEGVRAGDRLVLTNVPTGTSTYYPDRPTTAVFSRLIFSGITAQSFVVDNAVSADAGSSWQDVIRFTFTRVPERLMEISEQKALPILKAALTKASYEGDLELAKLPAELDRFENDDSGTRFFCIAQWR